MECLCLSSDWLCRVFRTPSKVQIWSQEWWGACPCTKEKLWAAAIAASVGWREIHSANQFPQKGLSCAKTPPVLSFQDGRMKWMPAVLTLSFVFRVDERDLSTHFPGPSCHWSSRNTQRAPQQSDFSTGTIKFERSARAFTQDLCVVFVTWIIYRKAEMTDLK